MHNEVTYLAYSKSSKEVLKTATLFKNLSINAFITGPSGSGKSLLAQYMQSDAVVADASDIDELLSLTERSDKIIIENFDKITKYSALDFSNKKVIGISSKKIDEKIIDKFFGITIELQPLSNREEDILPIAEKFLQQAKEVLMYDEEIILNIQKLDISQNCHSLKKSVFFQLLQDEITENEILSLMEAYLEKRMEGNNIYREFLYLYELPLITTGLRRYKSQLKLSDALGLNRNTLRKKVNELDIKVSSDDD